MNITFPDKVRWLKNVSENPLDYYSKRTQQRIQKTESLADSDKITSCIIPIDERFLDWFIPLYENEIAKKEQPVVFDIKKTTKNTEAKTYHALIIEEQGKKTGAVIFSVLEQQINIAYKIFNHGWETSRAPVNPSLYADYLLSNFALSKNKHFLSHGKDRNCYGKFSSIGLATHKLSLGYHPVLPEDFILQTIDPDQISTEMIIFGFEQSEVQAHVFFANKFTEKFSTFEKYLNNIEIFKHSFKI